MLRGVCGVTSGFAITLCGCSFGHMMDPSGFERPEPPQWSIDGSESRMMPQWESCIYVTVLSKEEERLFYLPGHVFGGTVPKHRIYYYRFFPRGRVYFSMLRVDDDTAAAIWVNDQFQLPLNIELDNLDSGVIGRYAIDGRQVTIELFTIGHPRWSFASVDRHYRVEEGEITDQGFRITRIAERHRSSWNDVAHSVSRIVVRTPVPGPMKRMADW